MNAAELVIIVIGTVTFVALTWSVSLRAGRYHGIFRFFSFESILLLGLLDWRSWFVDPFSLTQIASWVLLCGSIGPVVMGYRSLYLHGRAEDGFENTQILVQSGIYSQIRHPMYLSLVLLGTGVSLKALTQASIALAVVNCIALVATAVREEKETVQKFGSSYSQYMTRTKRFFPGVW